MEVSLIYSPMPRLVREWHLNLPSASSAASALENSGFFEDFPQLRGQNLLLGVWSQRVEAHHVLLHGDRLEVYRALQVEPKVARRERFKRQGSKAAGLFAGVRAGGKAGN